MESEHAWPNETLGVSRRAISLTLSHIALWRRFPTDGPWLYVFEDDAVLRHRWAQRKHEIPCYLAAAEDVVARGSASEIIYLGNCGAGYTTFPERAWDPWLTHRALPLPPRVMCDRRAPGNRRLWLRPCATMCTHAYAISRAGATSLWRRMRTQLAERGLLSDRDDPFTRYNLDVSLLNFYRNDHTRGRHRSGALTSIQNWPTCLTDHPTKTALVRGLFAQNTSEQHTIGEHGGGGGWGMK